MAGCAAGGRLRRGTVARVGRPHRHQHVRDPRGGRAEGHRPDGRAGPAQGGQPADARRAHRLLGPRRQRGQPRAPLPGGRPVPATRPGAGADRPPRSRGRHRARADGADDVVRAGRALRGGVADRLPATRAAAVAEGRVARGTGTHAWLPIIYGCDKTCTYCIVPFSRGPERSRPFDDVLAEARALADAGYREVTLLGQNVNSYGHDLPPEPRFARRPRGAPPRAAACRSTAGPTSRRCCARSTASATPTGPAAIPRLRFVTSHPWDLGERLIAAMAECPSVCEHLHLPVQSGDDAGPPPHGPPVHGRGLSAARRAAARGRPGHQPHDRRHRRVLRRDRDAVRDDARPAARGALRPGLRGRLLAAAGHARGAPRRRRPRGGEAAPAQRAAGAPGGDRPRARTEAWVGRDDGGPVRGGPTGARYARPRGAGSGTGSRPADARPASRVATASTSSSTRTAPPRSSAAAWSSSIERAGPLRAASGRARRRRRGHRRVHRHRRVCRRSSSSRARRRPARPRLSLELADTRVGPTPRSSAPTRARSTAAWTSAPPSPRPPSERRVPHHGLDLVDPDEPFTAADYRRAALDRPRQASRSAADSRCSSGAPGCTCARGRGVPARGDRTRSRASGRTSSDGSPDDGLARAWSPSCETASPQPRNASTSRTRVASCGRSSAARLLGDAPPPARAAIPPRSLWLGLRLATRSRHDRPSRSAPGSSSRAACSTRPRTSGPATPRTCPRSARSATARRSTSLDGRADLETAIATTVARTGRTRSGSETWFRSQPDITWLPDEDPASDGHSGS